MPLQKDYMERVFHGPGQLCSGSIICLSVVPCRALKLPLLRHEGKKQSEQRNGEAAEEEALDPAEQPLTRLLLLLIEARTGSLAWQEAMGRVIREGVAFLASSWSPNGEMPRGAALTSSKQQPGNWSPGRRTGWSLMTSNSGTKETAIKGLVTDIKSYCAALTPSALELLHHLPGEQGEALVQRWLACTSLSWPL